MTDRDTGDRSEAKPFGQEIFSFVAGLQFGTPEFRAVSDYFQLNRLEYELAIHTRNASDNKSSDAKPEYWKSEARITESEIALLKHQMYLGETQLEGYSNAYYHFESALESDLTVAADQEAEKKYPNDKTASAAYAKQIYGEVEGKLEDAVFRIIEGSKHAE